MVKWPRVPFIFKGYGTKEYLELVHTHVYELFCVYLWKVRVFDHFIDKYSRFGYVDRKSNALDKLIEFKAKLDNLLGKHIKALVYMVTHWTRPMMSHDLRLSSSHGLTNQFYYVVSQPWENIELVLKLAMALTYECDRKPIMYSLWIRSLLMEIGSNRYSQ